MRSILVIAPDADIAQTITTAFQKERHVETVTHPEKGLAFLKTHASDLVFLDIEMLQRMAPENGEAALQQVAKYCPLHCVVVMSAADRIRQAVKLVKAGAADYLTYPVDPAEVRLISDSVEELLIKQSELNYLRDKFWKDDSREYIHTQHDDMKDVFRKIRAVAPTKATVLLYGETGTGKSMLAKLIHRHSSRQNAQLIGVHCGAIPDTLLESELFGHEKGAFTGAIKKKLGKFEIAKGGTIFLDEIGTISPSSQIKLLQVLQDGTFSRVGGEETIETNARVIAATNADLGAMCEQGQFRKDLYYRLSAFPIQIPPLRERPEDIPFLVEIFLRKLNETLNKYIFRVDPHVVDALRAYAWPGNIRELENVMERAYILETASVLSAESFPSEFFQNQERTAVFPIDASKSLADARKAALEGFERKYLKELMATHNGKIRKSAEQAGIGTRQLHKMLSKYGIRKEEFKHLNNA